ncbi:ATPase [Acinetobacter brisouii]|nr:ATPase [Acinetobacter brisouii]
MNSEELESLFIESHEANSHNQISQFKNAVILNKKKHNPDFQEITYDTPVYFSINEVINFIRNKNKLTTYEDGEGVFLAVKNHKGIKNIDENLWEDLDFYPSSGNSKVTFFDSKVSSSDGFKGEFTRFVSRLETTLADKRLKFLLDSVDEQGNLLKTNDFDKILKQFLGYLDRSNVSILDLSAIPFEVISIVVSLVSRLLFDFSFHYSKIKHAHKVKNDIPILLVCEEAHIYLPRDEKIDYRASRKAIERIAKEGRKYGISLMVVSQRPSEVSDTILSQCSNFIALRLTNYQDQNYIKSLLPDSANTLVDMLPILSQGEAFIVGDSVILPSLIQFSEPNPSPQSGTVDVYDEWNKAWIDVEFSSVIDRWRS